MIDSITNVSSMSFTGGLGKVGLDASSALSQGSGATGAAAAGNDFGATLASMAGDMVGNLRAAEDMSMKGLTGEIDTRQVVDAVMQAEQTLQTALALREKITSAFLEISRMQI